MFTHRITRKILVTVAATATLSLTACGGDDTSTEPSAVQTADNGEVFNGADVTFATDMLPHHAQALEMVDLTEGRTLDPAVQALADAIRGAQAPEIDTMTGWLTSWGEEVPDTSAGMGDMDMTGMMSSEDMTALADASDAEFEDMWLTMMVEHHTGAVEMAKVEQTDGEFTDAIALAESIETSQEAEIATMKELLAS
ncbi:DUF305 domain-containing protein [soil metagenome]